MKRSIQLVTLVAFVFAAFTVSAQSVKPVRFGHVDTRQLMEIMPDVKKARATLQAKGDELQKDLEAMEAKGMALYKEYQDNEKTYSDLKRQSSQQEIQELGNRIQRFREVAEEQLRTTEEELLKPIYEKMQNAIKQVGDENNFTYIFDVGAIVYVSPSSEDILPLVKKKLGLL
jgi:outer membrane protein